jgi:hypothetical protein
MSGRGRGRGGGGGGRSKAKESPNPIFEEWLLEWREEAAGKGSKMQFVYSRVSLSSRFAWIVRDSNFAWFYYQYLKLYFGLAIPIRIRQEIGIECTRYNFPCTHEDRTYMRYKRIDNTCE